MANVSDVKSKYFEPDGADNDQVSATGSATTLVIADGGPYGNLTETITLTFLHSTKIFIAFGFLIRKLIAKIK